MSHWDRLAARLADRLVALSPWAVITLAGCAAIALMDVWRDAGPTAWPLVRGTLPNLVAVPTLAFGFLMVRFPERTPYRADRAAEQNRWFWRCWSGAVVAAILYVSLRYAAFLRE
jgi:hypothetical protein